jgi:hypothetical protein
VTVAGHIAGFCVHPHLRKGGYTLGRDAQGEFAEAVTRQGAKACSCLHASTLLAATFFASREKVEHYAFLSMPVSFRGMSILYTEQAIFYRPPL